MAYNKLHKKDFTIAVKTGNANGDQSKFAKEASKGELFFNNYDKKLYMATTSAGSSDAVLYNTNAFSLTPVPFLNNYSLEFAVDDYLTSPSAISLTSNWSISFWVRPSSNSTILSNTGPVYIFFDNGNVKFRGPGGEVTTTTYATNVWQHFVFTLDGSNNLEVYKNGSVTGPYSYTSSLGFSFTDVGRSVSYGIHLNGYLDELAVFDNLLSTSDVSNIYNGEDAGGSGGIAGTVGDLSTFNSGNGPLHWWRMGDNGTGTTISDQGNASTPLNLSMNNFPSNPYSTSELP